MKAPDRRAVAASAGSIPAGAWDWWCAHQGPAQDGTDPTTLEDYGAVRRSFMRAAPLVERVEGLTVEERMVGLSPEQRMEGLTPGERLLALAPEVLAVIPDDYIASLPADIQVHVRARRGR